MPPPLITEYKKRFVYKRLVENFLGGPKLFTPVIYILIQVTIFIIPALIVSLINFGNENVDDWKWKSIFTGCSLFLVDVCLALVIILIKRRRNNVLIVPVSTEIEGNRDGNEAGVPTIHLQTPSIQEPAFMAEEDVITRQGCLKSSTWNVIAPNVTLGLEYMFAVTFSSISFGFSTPFMLSHQIHPVLRGFVIMAMCNCRYSSVINSPPEIATFDALDKSHLFFRPFYPLVLAGAWHLSALTFPADTDQGMNLLTPFSLTVACLPILWTFGFLPPLDSIFPWLLETILNLSSGSSPSHHYFGTFVSLAVVIICPIVVFIISQEPLVIILAECLCGYITSCDTGRIASFKPGLCEDTPTKSFLRQLVHPLVIIFTSLICVLITWLNTAGVSTFEYQMSFAVISLTISISSWVFRQCTITRKLPVPKPIVFPISVLHGLLTFLLHIWLTMSIEHDKNEWSSLRTSELHSLGRLVPYLLTIRGFSMSISEPRKSTIDFSLTFVWKQYMGGSESSFVLILYIVSLITGRIKRFLKHFKTICSIWYAFAVSSILPSKFCLLGTAIACLPISFMSLISATIVEGATMTLVFSLPIFFLGFPRPSSFWCENWFPKSKDKKQIVLDIGSLDWKIYSEIGPLLASSLSKKAHAARLKMHRGDCYLARYEDRLLFIRILSNGWNFAYIHIKGLEMQEQTSCHHQEAAKIDEILENTFGESNNTCLANIVNPFSIHILTPMMCLKLPTYSESKSTISVLRTNEDKATFRDMFYRSFSYLWIKSNPALKGDSYQRLLNTKGLHMLSSSPTQNGHPTPPTEDIPPNPFSVNNALFKFTAPHVRFINVDKTPTARSRSDSVFSGVQNPAFENDDLVTEEQRTFSRQSVTSTLMSPTSSSTRLIQSTGIADKNVSNSDRLSSIWIKQCIGDIIPPNAVRARVEKLCRGVWDTVLGPDDDKDIDLSDFFQDDFSAKLKTLAVSRKVDMQDIALKAFRYATKLALDEIYSSTNYASNSKVIVLDAETEEDLFSQLTLYERDYQFCTVQDIPLWIQQNTNHIITIVKNTNSDQNQDSRQSVMRILNYETEGVEFRLGQLDQFTVEGIWSNLNLELLFFTSDDDERFSIQHDRILLRNILTQCAKTLGYPVYDQIFRLNLLDFSVRQVD